MHEDSDGILSLMSQNSMIKSLVEEENLASEIVEGDLLTQRQEHSIRK